MTVEQLLKPRRKVIERFPGMSFLGDSGFRLNDIFYPIFKHEKYFYNEVYIDDYPHLFKKLDWHEERKAEDMPQYIKNNAPGAFCFGQIYKVDKILELSQEFVFKDEISSYSNLHFKHTLPATEQEYTQYLTTLKK